jgi:putative nucleotidyltransferase with HDIG domain
MKKVLVVDDNEQNLYLLQHILKGHSYDVITAANGIEALERARSTPPDIIISDILMPVMDGFALCREWRKDKQLQHIPFIFYTATYKDPRDKELGLSLGAAHFIVKPQDPKVLIALLQQVGERQETGLEVVTVQPAPGETDYYKLYSEALIRKLEDKMLSLEEVNRALEQEIIERKRVEEQLHHTLDNLRRAISATIKVMVSAVEIRDPYTAGHQIRSANIALAIATEMGLPQEKIDGIRIAGSIHDIGKLSIPAEILSKPAKLTNNEFSLIKEHSRSGYEILKEVESPWPLAEIVYQHHERMDGSGYPRNMKGDDILIEARILAVSDVVEAMASHRPYRPALGIDAALEEIEKNRGILYDNTAVNACLKLFREKAYHIEGTCF